MSTSKAHPHAELTISIDDAKALLHGIGTANFNNSGMRVSSQVSDVLHRLQSQLEVKQAEPALLQGHTMEQWEFMREQGVDCEFSDNEDFSGSVIAKLHRFNPSSIESFVDSEDNYEYRYCRPRRAKGVKQPWFGGECPVDGLSRVLIYTKDGDNEFCLAREAKGWVHIGVDSDITAFIEP